jgi:transglutaminase-like putative cysteine protease
MKRIQITHRTEYHYRTPVSFGPHRALVRPREGHDVHIESSRLKIDPPADVRWLRDIYGNSIAVLSFSGPPADKLSLYSELIVAHYDENPLDFLIDPNALSYPFQYAADEQAELIPYRLSSYPHDGLALQTWLSALYTSGQLINTFELLDKLNTRIFEGFKYVPRDEPGVQLPSETIVLGTGSCRDYAVLMMEAARHWGFGARFVTGYIQMDEGQHGSTHAWTEIYIPGAGWRGFDPTNNKFAGAEHVSVAVARDPDKASPLIGAWEGPFDAFDHMEVSVQVVPL